MSLYYIDTLLEYVTEPQSSCKHPHRCNPMHFLTSAVSFYCVYFVIERKVRSIYLLIHSNTAQELWVCATAPHWSKRNIAGSYMRSYEIKRLLDNKYLSTIFYCR